ncbi:hypothetical protein AB0E69_15420 [Kribbella sp. NPDC026611]|uniref:hypothetical protein n=1 Tax=Kribbella sp. NPDC026611 TaxID=3154911 RepID=UPI0033CAE509
MTPPTLRRRRLLLALPTAALAAKFSLPTLPAQAAKALKKKPECVADLIRPS